MDSKCFYSCAHGTEYIIGKNLKQGSLKVPYSGYSGLLILCNCIFNLDSSILRSIHSKENPESKVALKGDEITTAL
jgi:hypothetical protein